MQLCVRDPAGGKCLCQGARAPEAGQPTSLVGGPLG